MLAIGHVDSIQALSRIISHYISLTLKDFALRKKGNDIEKCVHDQVFPLACV